MKTQIVNTMREVTIDASGKTLGRVATAAAVALRGKDVPAFERNAAPTVKVKITNAAKMFIAESKKKGTDYVRYTGYPGGLKHASLEMVVAKKGIAEPLKLAIYGMLPGNKLRAEIMKNLSIEA